MKKLVAYLLVLALALTLFGCNAEPAAPTTTGQTPFATTTTAPPPTSTSPAEDPFAGLIPSFSLLPEEDSGRGPTTTAELTIQTIPKTLDNPDNLPVLKWVCLVDAGNGTTSGRRWSSAAVEELNQMLSDRDMPFRVQFKIVSSKSNNNDWFSRIGIDQLIEGADLIYGRTERQELPAYFAPITQYITGDSQLSLANAVGHELDWRNASLGDEIYGIPTDPLLVRGNGWWINTAFMEKCGLTAEDFSRNFWEMDDVLEIMYKQNNNKPFLYYNGNGYALPGTDHGVIAAFPLGGIYDAIRYTDCQAIGGSFGIDLSAEKPTVVDMLATDFTRSVQQAFLRYRNAGYLTDNYALKKLCYDQTFGSEPYHMEMGITTCVPISETMVYEGDRNRVTGISKNSQYPQEAAALLQLIAEDEEFRMQLFYGKEGRDYKIVDGAYTLIPQANGSTYSLDILSPLSCFSGLEWRYNETTRERDNTPSSGSLYFTHLGKSPLESYRDNIDALRYWECPVIFDYSGYEKELNNIAVVMGRYYVSFQGLHENNYAEMLEWMELAGSKKVMAALQQQLDAWITDNPDWNPLE